MKYTVDVQGMHCMGCVKLVTMGLTEQGLQKVEVDLAGHRATFESVDKKDAVQGKVDAAAADLTDFTFAAVLEG
jgi:copper chaperone CopZ